MKTESRNQNWLLKRLKLKTEASETKVAAIHVLQELLQY